MRLLIVIATLSSLLFSCTANENIKAPQTIIKFEENLFYFKSDTLYYNQEKYSGCLFDLNEKTLDTLLLSFFSEGQLHGTQKKWYAKNKLLEIREYQFGRKNGKQLSFWENGNKRFEFVAVNDACEGELNEWDENGNLIHLAHFRNGQEEGEQKMWYENGKIRANYIIKDGRRYGLLGTKNCKNVSDSIFSVK